MIVLVKDIPAYAFSSGLNELVFATDQNTAVLSLTYVCYFKCKRVFADRNGNHSVFNRISSFPDKDGGVLRGVLAFFEFSRRRGNVHFTVVRERKRRGCRIRFVFVVEIICRGVRFVFHQRLVCRKRDFFGGFLGCIKHENGNVTVLRVGKRMLVAH